jgi:hypothetical protein
MLHSSKILEIDENLGNRSLLSVDAVVELLGVCLKTTYFQVDSEFYQQTDGVAVGFPLSPIISNIFVENLRKGWSGAE